MWALDDYGFKVIISTSFADIFYNNCFKNGILPICVSDETLERLFSTKSEIEVDLETQSIKVGNVSISFQIEQHWKKILLEGLDDIAMTLLHEDQIANYERSHKI